MLLMAAVFFLAGTLVSAVLLRASIALLGRISGDGRAARPMPGIPTMPVIPKHVSADPPSGPSATNRTPTSESANPYRSPVSGFQLNMPGPLAGGTAGELSFARAWRIMLATAILLFAVNSSIALVLGSIGYPAPAVVGIARMVINFLLTAGVIQSMLPTTFRRAMLISAIMFFGTLVIVLLVVLVLLLIGF